MADWANGTVVSRCQLAPAHEVSKHQLDLQRSQRRSDTGAPPKGKNSYDPYRRSRKRSGRNRPGSG